MFLLTYEEEVWKDIPNYEGLYQASSLGRIKAMPKVFYSNGGRQEREEYIMKQWMDSDGYLKLALHKNGVRRDTRIHVLVAETFCDNPNNYKEVNHIKPSKRLNTSKNLEWCTRSHNIAHAARLGLNNIAEHMKGKPRGNQVLLLDMQTGIFYESIKEAADIKGFNKNTLQAMLAGKYKNKSSLKIV